jgi:FdhD protein
VISSIDAIDSIDIVEEEVGIELRIWLKAPDAAEFLGRRRKMAGPTGCGLCGHREPGRGDAPAARGWRGPRSHAGSDHDGGRFSFPLADP